MKKSYLYIIITTLSILLLVSWFTKSETQIIKIPSKTNTVTINNPVPVVLYDTVQEKGQIIYKEIPNKVNEQLLEDYQIAKDSITKLNLYKEAVTERNYTEILEDSVQKITVNSKVIGTLKSQTIQYVTKEQSIFLKPVKLHKTEVFAGISTNIPTIPNIAPSIGLNLHLKTKKNLYTVGFDTAKNVNIGVSFKL